MAKKETPATKICKHCQTEIPYKAKICPNCKKRVKGGAMKWILIILALLFVFTIFGGNDKSSDDPVKIGNVDESAAPNSTPDDIEPAETVPTVFRVGDILQDGNMKIVYISSGEHVEENEFLQPEDGYKYIYLNFAFENTSDSNDDAISFYSFEGYADGYNVEMFYGGEEDLSATLSAGRSTTGKIYFCVPVDATEIEVEYTPNAFLDKKITFLYEGEKDSGYVPELNTTASAGAYHVGDIVESSSLRISYLSCEEYISDNPFIQPKDGYHYMTCTFEFENIGDSDEFVSVFDFDCYADGMNCESTYVDENPLSATLSAGRKAKGSVTFEVPIDATVIEAEYLSNVWTSNRVVFTVD